VTNILAVVFFLLILVTGLAAASDRVRWHWVALLLLLLFALRAVMPVYIEDCSGVAECGKRGHMEGN